MIAEILNDMPYNMSRHIILLEAAKNLLILASEIQNINTHDDPEYFGMQESAYHILDMIFYPSSYLSREGVYNDGRLMDWVRPSEDLFIPHAESIKCDERIRFVYNAALNTARYQLTKLTDYNK